MEIRGLLHNPRFRTIALCFGVFTGLFILVNITLPGGDSFFQLSTTLLSYRVSDLTVSYLAHELHFAGFSDQAIVEHPDWGLWGMERQEVLSRMSELSDHTGLIVQHAGSIVQITWMLRSMEEVLNAYTR